MTGWETPVSATMAEASIRDRYEVKHASALKGEVRFPYPRMLAGFPKEGRQT